MPKRVEPLTDVEVRARVKRIAADGVQKDFAVGGLDGGGLFLRVDGTKRPPYAGWYLRRRGADGGKIGLGGYPATTLKEARAEAAARIKAAQAVGMGVGAANKAAKEEKRRKAEEARRRAKMLTVAGVFAQWQAEMRKGESKYAATNAASDASLFSLHIGAVILADGKRFGDKPIDAITARDLQTVCLSASKPIEAKGRRSEGAPLCAGSQKRVRVILRGLYDCAISAGLLSSNLMLGEEFKTLERAMHRTAPAGGHNGALTPAEMPAFIRALCERITNPATTACASMAARALLFAIFTNSRRKNVQQLTRGDVADGVWTISAGEMKISENGNHRVYLAPEAVELIESAPVLAESDYAFASPRTGDALSDSTLAKVIWEMSEERKAAGGKAWLDAEQSKALGRDVAITPHGLARATFKTWTEEAIDEKTGHGFTHKAAELNLHHKDNSDRNNGAYARSPLEEERRRLSAQWARYCLSETPAELWARVTGKAPDAPQAQEAVGVCAPCPPPEGQTEIDRLKKVYGPSCS